MSEIRFIIEGDEASDIGLELEHYIQTEWRITTDRQTKKFEDISDKSQTKVTIPEAILVLLTIHKVYKVGKDTQEVVEDFRKLIDWLSKGNYGGIKLDMNGTLYPVSESLSDAQIEEIALELKKAEQN